MTKLNAEEKKPKKKKFYRIGLLVLISSALYTSVFHTKARFWRQNLYESCILGLKFLAPKCLTKMAREKR